MKECVFHKIRSIGVIDKYTLCAQFDCGIAKEYDICPITRQIPVFEILLEDEQLFKKVKVDTGGYGIIWNNSLDLSSEEIWNNGVIIKTSFDGKMSFSDAATLWGIEESTLRKAVSYGKLVPGIDCWKFGKQWVVNKSSMVREYGNLEIYESNDDYLMAAEQEVKYGKEY